MERIPEGDLVIETNNVPQFTPAKPKITSVELDIEHSTITISFYSSDPDNDLAGYQVFIFDHSRGWDYNQFYGSDSVKSYWANPNGWKPEMYELLFMLPPSNLDLINLEADSSKVVIQVNRDQLYYISVMPYDRYGLSVGRTLYPLSNELLISIP